MSEILLMSSFFSSKEPYTEREVAVRKLSITLSAMRYRFKNSRNFELRFARKKTKGDILTVEHVEKIKGALEKGNDSIATSDLLS